MVESLVQSVILFFCWGLEVVDGFVQALSKWSPSFHVEWSFSTWKWRVVQVERLDTVMWVPVFCTLLEGIGWSSSGWVVQFPEMLGFLQS